MKFQVSTLTALSVLSTGRAKTLGSVSKNEVLGGDLASREAAFTFTSDSTDPFVPRKILQTRQVNEKAHVAKTLKNPNSNVRGSELNAGAARHELDADFGILDNSYDKKTIHQLQNTARHLQECQGDGGRGCWEPNIDCNAYCSQFGDRPLIEEANGSFAELVESYIMGESIYDGPINCWNTSLVKDMSLAFCSTGNNCYGRADDDINEFNSPIGCFDTSAVTTMNSMFRGASSFNQTVNTWDTSSVTDMSYMFSSARDFNQPIASWDTSSVTDMSRMFSEAAAFNSPVGSLVSSATTDVTRLFFSAYSFDQPVEDFDTSAVTTMSGMFASSFNYRSAFNQPVDSFVTSSVTSMNGMFERAAAFNQPVDFWDTSSVQTMDEMFKQAYSFNQPVNSWDTAAVSRLSGTFRDAIVFNQPVDLWDTSSVGFMGGVFSGATAFNQPVASWNTSGVTNIREMFADGSVFNQPVESWDTSAVTNMSFMFYNNTVFNQAIDSWDISNVSNMNWMFRGATEFNQCLSTWAVKASATVTTDSMFDDSSCPIQENPSLFTPWCQGLDICASSVASTWTPGVDCNVYCEQFGDRPVVTPDNFRRVALNEFFDLFNENIKTGFAGSVINCWDTSRITDMSATFSTNTGFFPTQLLEFNRPLGCWNTSSVTSMNNMFRATRLFNQPIDQWDVSRVTDMDRMFEAVGEIETYVVEGPRFNQCLSTWADKTPNSVSTSNMFADTECPGDVTPDATVGPWCQGEEQSCIAVVDDSPREPAECKDSPLRAVTPGQCASGRCGRTCRFIKDTGLCKNGKYRKHCRKSCGICNVCRDSTAKFRIRLSEPRKRTVWRRCKWVARKPDVCRETGVSQTCPRTCGICGRRGKKPEPVSNPLPPTDDNDSVSKPLPPTFPPTSDR